MVNTTILAAFGRVPRSFVDILEAMHCDKRAAELNMKFSGFRKNQQIGDLKHRRQT